MQQITYPELLAFVALMLLILNLFAESSKSCFVLESIFVRIAWLYVQLYVIENTVLQIYLWICVKPATTIVNRNIVRKYLENSIW